MTFLLDVHLPISLSKFLNNQEKCSAVHVNQILQKWNTPDNEICRYADANDMILLTKDSDFKNSHFINKTPGKTIRITLGNVSNKEIISLFEKHLPLILKLSNEAFFYAEISKEQLLVFN